MGNSNDEIGTKSVRGKVLQYFHNRLPSVAVIIIIIRRRRRRRRKLC
jgi:hypothetical protein